MPVVITTGPDDVAAPASTVAEKIEVMQGDELLVEASVH
jgi:hypothetical protein